MLGTGTDVFWWDVRASFHQTQDNVAYFFDKEVYSMEVPDQLLCLFSAELTERDGSYVFKVPDQEHQLGEVEAGQKIRVAILPSAGNSGSRAAQSEKEPGPLDPPVDEGETRVVEIEGLGEQGDGIARVERGFVVIVPDTEQRERVRVEITDVHENVAFGTVVERLSYYE